MKSVLAIVAIICCASWAAADDALDNLTSQLQALDANAIPADEREAARGRLGKELYAQLKAANNDSSALWKQIDSRETWEAFRQNKLAKLKASLNLPQQRPPVKLHVAGEIAGEGYKIQKVIYATRPQWYVTANLYLPSEPTQAMPGILLSHSHHSPKTQGELQDMGATWARAGCAVLVPDHLGHGERRQHPFASASDYTKEFAVGRQDYYFRYDTSLQLYLAGESLMGWLVHDLKGGVDVLLSLPGIDKGKIILLGGVAGGGDPAAVTGAVDERINCVGPFNFGGPQPETRYPLPEDAETSFNYAGGGSWESTRNLADSASEGFLPWVIVGSIAPRKLIYGHEFSWDGQRDPVWKRFNRIWGFYDAKDNAAVAHGKGNLKGQEPESSHCGNIGAFHRRMIHPLLTKWYGIASSPDTEFSARHSAAELACWNDELKKELKPKLLHEVLRESIPKQDAGATANSKQWHALLKVTDGQQADPKHVASEQLGEVRVERVHLVRDVSLLLLLPKNQPAANKSPLVLALAQQGKARLLKERAEEVAKLLQQGIAVGLVDVQGTGETSDDQDWGQYGAPTSYSATALMLGKPLLGRQLQDLRAALEYCRARKEIATDRIGLWGDSLAKPIDAQTEFRYPRRIDRPGEATPQGPTLALLLALDVPEVKAIYTHGGLASFGSALDSSYVQIPHDHAVPGLLRVGDVDRLLAALSTRAVATTASVTAQNRLVDRAAAKQTPAEFLGGVLTGR